MTVCSEFRTFSRDFTREEPFMLYSATLTLLFHILIRAAMPPLPWRSTAARFFHCIGLLILLTGLSIPSPAQQQVSINSASPLSGSGPTLTFSAAFEGGLTQVTNMWAVLYISPQSSGAIPVSGTANVCQIALLTINSDPSVDSASTTGQWSLANDAGTASITSTNGANVGNSQCMLDVSASSWRIEDEISYSMLYVTYTVQFTSAWVGLLSNTWLYGDERTGVECSGYGPSTNNCTGWQHLGTWTPEAPSLTIGTPPGPGAFPPIDWVPTVPSNINDFNVVDQLEINPGYSGNMIVIATDDETGLPIAGASIICGNQAPTTGSGWHPHDTGYGRPNIEIAPGPYVTNANGEAQFPVNVPPFAGIYWISCAGSTANDAQTVALLENVIVADPGAPFYSFPAAGWLGTYGTSVVIDSQHAGQIFFSTLFFQEKMLLIGSNFYLIGWPWTVSPVTNPYIPVSIYTIPDSQYIVTAAPITGFARILPFRMSLPWGGWLDDDGSGSQFWSLFNTDGHTDGLEADVAGLYHITPGTLFIGNALVYAIKDAGCQVAPAPWENGTINQSSLQAAQVWHIYGCGIT